MEDIAGHVGYAFIALGMWLLTKKSAWGFVARLVGETIWTVVGIFLGLTSIWGWGLLFMVLDVRGFVKWRREKVGRLGTSEPSGL